MTSLKQSYDEIIKCDDDWHKALLLNEARQIAEGLLRELFMQHPDLYTVLPDGKLPWNS